MKKQISFVSEARVHNIFGNNRDKSKRMKGLLLSNTCTGQWSVNKAIESVPMQQVYCLKLVVVNKKDKGVALPRNTLLNFGMVSHYI